LIYLEVGRRSHFAFTIDRARRPSPFQKQVRADCVLIEPRGA